MSSIQLPVILSEEIALVVNEGGSVIVICLESVSRKGTGLKGKWIYEVVSADCQRRRKNRPRGGAKPGQWRGAKRHGARAPQIAGACHGALARRANLAGCDQVVASAFRARLCPSR